MFLQSLLKRLLQVSLIALATPVTSQAVNPPWELQTFSYGWDNQNDTITQCRNLQITWSNMNVTGAPKPSPPYTLIWYLAGYEPYKLNMGAGSPGGYALEYGWLVDLPTGGPYINMMIDGAGANGGVSNGITNVLAPTNGECQVQQLTPSTLDFVVPSANPQCGTIQMSVAGGTPPYTLYILPENFQPKAVTYTTGLFDYILDVQAGVNTYLAVEDSTGKGAVATSFAVGAGDASCLKAAPSLVPDSPQLSTVYKGISSGTFSASGPTSSATGGAGTTASTSHHSNTGVIAGVVIAVVMVLIIALLAFFWRRHQKKSRATSRDATTDLNEPHVDPYYGNVVQNRPESTFNPGYTEPGMAEAGRSSLIMTNTLAPSTDPRNSYSSTQPSSSQALLGAQRGDRKIDPTAASAEHNRPLLPNTPRTSLTNPSSYATSSTGPASKVQNLFAVSNQEMPLVEQRQAAGRASSPALPPGAAMPSTAALYGISSPNAGQVERSNTVATTIERHKTPPPQYTPGN